jgi:hypothetical protein
VLSVHEFMESPRRFSEVFNLMVRVHPNHAQHLRLLFTLERQFARTLGMVGRPPLSDSKLILIPYSNL